MEMTSGLDGDASPLVIDHTTFTQDSEQISQEFQLNGDFGEVQFTGGLYYFHEEASETARVPLGGGLLLIATAIDHEVDSYAVFGEGTYNLTDKFSLNFGARYTEDEKSLYLDQENRTDFLLQVGIPPSLFPRDDTFFLSPAGELKASFDNFSVRAGANYQFTSDIFAYFTFSQGYKSGGFSTRLTAPVLPEDIDKMSYDPEEADTYELGLKSEFFDRRLRANLAVFSNDYNDIQVVVREGISPLVRNAGEATIRGAELELTALPIDQLRIDVGVGYTDAEYTSVLATAAPVTTESKFQNAPERTASAAVTYSVDMVSGSRFDVTGTASYRSKVYNDTTTSSEVIAQSGHTILGMQARYIAPDESWSFAVGGNDLTDKAPIIAGTYDTAVGYVPVIYSRGREYYARLSFNF
jgi:iron complex outermembrane receptor protein